MDLSRLPSITFTDVERYAASSTGCESTAKAYKYFAEPGYLHNIKSKCMVDELVLIVSRKLLTFSPFLLRKSSLFISLFLEEWVISIACVFRICKLWQFLQIYEKRVYVDP